MGNSNSSPPSSLSSTPRVDNGSLKRRNAKSVRLPSTTKPPKPQIKATLSNRTSGGISDCATPSPTPDDDPFHKSHSMFELRNPKQSTINSSPLNSHNGSFRLTAPEISEIDVTTTLLNSRFAHPSTSAPSTINRQKSIRRNDPTHPLIPNAREICRTCFENPHNDLGNRVLSRVYEKRVDFQRFVQTVGKEKWPLLTANLQNFVEEIVANIENVDSIQRFSRRYGEEHVPLKGFGFKPDFWVSIADAIIVECVILDMAAHPPTDTVSAWSQLCSIMFASIRDGYYNALRAQRMSTRKKSIRRQESVSTADSSSDISSTKPANISPIPIIADDSIDRLSPNGVPKSESFAFKLDRPIFE